MRRLLSARRRCTNGRPSGRPGTSAGCRATTSPSAWEASWTIDARTSRPTCFECKASNSPPHTAHESSSRYQLRYYWGNRDPMVAGLHGAATNRSIAAVPRGGTDVATPMGFAAALSAFHSFLETTAGVTVWTVTERLDEGQGPFMRFAVPEFEWTAAHESSLVLWCRHVAHCGPGGLPEPLRA